MRPTARHQERLCFDFRDVMQQMVELFRLEKIVSLINIAFFPFLQVPCYELSRFLHKTVQ